MDGPNIVDQHLRGRCDGCRFSVMLSLLIQIEAHLVFPPGGGWFTITPMLQDLDTLAARIGQMVQLTRQLQAERASLQARLTSLEQERSALRDQLARQLNEHASVSQRLSEHDNEIGAVRAQAEAAQLELRLEASRYKADYDKVSQTLQASQSEADRLRAAASAAKDRIDAILERLPGAPQE